MKKELEEYHRKRDFSQTSEPRPDNVKAPPVKSRKSLMFIVQKHHARNLHYDFRLELNGTLKSWAIPKGPSLDPKVKRLAVQVEDHPLSYANFEGTIPKGQYGAGHVIVWDNGIWEPQDDPDKGYRQGKLKFILHGAKLSGAWNLIRTRSRNAAKEQWLLIKENDESARDSGDYDVVEAQPKSVLQSSLLKKRSGASTTSSNKKKTSRSRTKSKTTLPDRLKPQLATLVSQPPTGKWLYEIKFDGYRLLARTENGKVRLFTRNGHDWTDRLSAQAEAVAALGLGDSWLDGEILVMNDGKPDFQALQNALDEGRSQKIVYYLFDAPFLNGTDLRDRGVEERRGQLEDALRSNSSDLLRFSETFASATYRNLYDSACAMSLEGLIGKRAESPYVSRRSTDWIKLKCLLRQEFVIVGYTEPKGQRPGFGALLLGVHSEPGTDKLLYCGKVGTGFNNRKLREIHALLRKDVIEKSALASTQGVETNVRWLRPTRVCEVEFSSWTREGRIRHAVFVSLREDKPAGEIVREHAEP